MQDSTTTFTTTFKCGHHGEMPPHITTPEGAKTYARWAKGQGLCFPCLKKRNRNELYSHAYHNRYAELVGSIRQIHWALAIRHSKLTELDFAQRQEALQQNTVRRKRLRAAHDKLAQSKEAKTWIEARDLSMDALVEFCLGTE